MRYYWHRALAWLRDHWKIVTMIGSAVVTVTLIIWFVWFMFFATAKVSTEVTGYHWHRTMEVQDFQPRRKGEWYDHPGDAYDVYEDYRYHYTKTVQDPDICFSSTDSKGNTTQTCYSQSHQEDVYDWWYEYTVDRWEHLRDLVTDGINQTPLWHGIENEPFDNTDVFGHQRLSGATTERYEINTNNKQHPVVKCWQSVLESIPVGATFTLNVNRNGDIRSINWPEGYEK